MSGSNCDWTKWTGSHLLKIIVVGDPGVGKSSFIRRYVHNEFDINSKPTLGIDFALKILEFERSDGKKLEVNIQLWDIAGQERYGNMTRIYYQGARGAIVCVDLSRKDTLNLAEQWIQDIKNKVIRGYVTYSEESDNEYSQLRTTESDPSSLREEYTVHESGVPIFLMGNKADIKDYELITAGELQEKCNQHNLVGSAMTSSLANTGITETMEHFVYKLMNDFVPYDDNYHEVSSQGVIVITDTSKKDDDCCI